MFNFKQEEKREFLKAAFLTLRKFGFVSHLETDAFNDTTRKFYYEWGGDIKLSNCIVEMPGKVADAIKDFGGFVKSKADVRNDEIVHSTERRTVAADRLSVSINLPLGSRGRLSFSAEGKINYDFTPDELEEAYADLFAKAWKGVLAIENHPAIFPMGGIKKPYTPQSGDAIETFEFTSIVSTSEGGRRTFKVKGGKFAKFGVRVFGEVLIKADIDPASIDGEKYLVGTATVQYKANGEPNKVIGIELKRTTI